MTDRLLGVVLCGGKSSRMGQDKSTLQFPNGTTYLEHAVSRLEMVCDAVVISGPKHQQRPGSSDLRSGDSIVPDPVAYQGPATGIAAALGFAAARSFAACLFTPVDMPDLGAEDLRKLKTAWEQSRVLTVATAEQLQPLVAVYPISLKEELDLLAGSEDRSLIKWIASQSCTHVSLPAAACRNINTPEDLADGP